MADNDNNSGCGCSIGIGGLIAGLVSWSTHHSIGWLIVHVVLGWLYVIYWILVYGLAGK
jgi:hypothetical protein